MIAQIQLHVEIVKKPHNSIVNNLYKTISTEFVNML